MPLLALLELWMISSGRSAPSSEENVGLMREWRGDGWLFPLVAENWIVLFCNLIRLHFSEIQVSVFPWNILNEKGLLICVIAKRCQIGGAWKISLRPLGKTIKVFRELAVPECGLALTCSSLVCWYLAFYTYSLKAKLKFKHYYWSSTFHCPVLSLCLFCDWLPAKTMCLLVSRDSSSGPGNNSHLWPLYTGVHPQQPHCHLH